MDLKEAHKRYGMQVSKQTRTLEHMLWKWMYIEVWIKWWNKLGKIN